MTERYRYFDAPDRPQAAQIIWEMVTPYDDDQCAPDRREDGYWPSRNPADPGYIGAGADFDKAEAAAKERLDAFKRGDWHYCGVFARATVSIPAGGNSFVRYVIDSPGIWGIESDAADYLKGTYEQERANMLEHLATIGDAAKVKP